LVTRASSMRRMTFARQRGEDAEDHDHDHDLDEREAARRGGPAAAAAWHAGIRESIIARVAP